MARLSRIVSEMGKARSVALAVAAAWGVALIVGTFVVPVYSTDSSSGRGSATLVGVNGAWVVALIAIPLAIVLFVAEALWKRRESPNAGPIAWTITGLLIAFNLLGMLTIGIFLLPVTISLVVACAIQTQRPASPQPQAM